MPRILDYKLYAKLHLQCTGLCLKPHWIYYKPNFILSHGEGGLMPKLPRCGIQSDHIWKKCAVLFFIILSQFHTSIFNSKLEKKKKKVWSSVEFFSYLFIDEWQHFLWIKCLFFSLSKQKEFRKCQIWTIQWLWKNDSAKIGNVFHSLGLGPGVTVFQK